MTVSLDDARIAADALRGLVVTATSTDQQLQFLMLQHKNEPMDAVSTASSLEKDIRETRVGQRISVTSEFEFRVYELSILYVTSVLSLLRQTVLAFDEKNRPLSPPPLSRLLYFVLIFS